MKRTIYILFALVLLFQSCQNPAEDTTAVLRFSVDTLLFDTVFTHQGSSTRTVMIYNPGKADVTINKVGIADGGSFRINLDGESDPAYMKDIVLAGGDSLFLFVRATIDPQNSNSPVLVTDQVVFDVQNGGVQKLQLEAFGQDVELIDSLYIAQNYTFHAGKPYLIQNWIASAPDASVVIEAGSTFYMHNGSQAMFYGSLTAEGTVEAPITFTCDRLDDYIQQIPYSYVPGQWSGVYLYDYDGVAPAWKLSHVSIISAVNGLFCYGKNYSNRPTLSLDAARIHNHDQYGLVLQNVDASVTNSEISNCASYCIYLSGGESRFVHNTIASYFRYTQYNSNTGLYDTQREDVAAVYIYNLSKDRATNASFYNNIITGVRDQQLLIAAPLPDLYGGEFVCNYLKTDSLALRNVRGNVYAQENDTVFRNNYYAEHIYYDFRLDSVSPARNMADSAIVAAYPTDLQGNARNTYDAGCYAYEIIEN